MVTFLRCLIVSLTDHVDFVVLFILYLTILTTSLFFTFYEYVTTRLMSQYNASNLALVAILCLRPEGKKRLTWLLES